MLAVGNIDPLYVKRSWVSVDQLSLACDYHWNGHMIMSFGYSR